MLWEWWLRFLIELRKKSRMARMVALRMNAGFFAALRMTTLFVLQMAFFV